MTRTKPTRSKPGGGCLAVFGLPFAAVGVGMLGLLAWTYLEYLALQRWQEVPARIVRAKLEVHHDDSTTYGLVFGGIGFSLLVGGLYARRNARTAKLLAVAGGGRFFADGDPRAVWHSL